MMESSSSAKRAQPEAACGIVLGPRVARHTVEDAVHQSRLVRREEGARDVDIFGDDDAGRHVAPRQKLEDAAAQDGAERQVDARERPGRRQRGMDDRIDLPLPLHHAADERAEERRIGRPELLAFELLAEPVRLELGDDRRQRRAADVHLVERLHRAEPRGAALIGGLGGEPARSAMRARASRAAPPSRRPRPPRAAPLFISLTRARAQACVVVLDGQDAVADRKRPLGGEVHDRARGFVRDDVVVRGLAADHAAERT